MQEMLSHSCDHIVQCVITSLSFTIDLQLEDAIGLQVRFT